jgi:hypothetical protein
VPAKLLIQLLGESTSAVSAIKKTSAASDEATGAAKKTGSAWSGVGKIAAAAGGAFAAAKIVQFAKDSVSAASDLNESWSKVGVVFGKSAGEVYKWSATSATAMGLSRQQALEAASTYGNLAVALGLPPAQAAKMSTSLVGLAGDLASFNNVPVGDALDALRSGLTGEVEPLRRFGVSLSQAQVQAEALRMGLTKAPVDMAKVTLATQRLALAQGKQAESVKKYGASSKQAQAANVAVASSQQNLSKAMAGGKVELTAAQKAQATYSLIMKQTSVAQGDFARTSSGLANQQRIASAQWKDMQSTVGTALLPIVRTFASMLTSTLIPALTVVAKVFKNNSTVIQILAAAIGAIIIVTKIWTITTAILNSTLLANPIFLVVVAVVALVAVIVLVATKTRFFQAVWAAVSRAMVAAWNATTRAIWVAWNATVGAIVGAWNATYRVISSVFRAILSAAMSVWSWIKGNWPLLLGVITGPFGLAVVLIIRYWSQVSGFFAGVVGAIAGVFSRVYGYITQPFISAFNLIRSVAEAALGWIQARVQTVMAAVAWGINAAKSVYNAFARTWNAIQVTMPAIDTHIPGVGKVGGFTLGLPDLPILARGGLLTRSGLVFAHAGEVISPAPARARGAGPLVRIEHAHFSEKIDVATFGRRLAWELETAGV